MEKILTPEEKKYLGAVSRMIQSYGTTYAFADFNFEHYLGRFEAEDLSFQDINNFDSNRNIEIPNKLKEIFEKCLNYVEQNIDNYDHPDVEYGTISVHIDAVKRVLKISFNYYYYDTEDAATAEFDVDNDGETIEQVFETLSEISSENSLRLEYNGGGDSGYIESKFDSGESVPADIEDWCYRVLEDMHGGWEINEGSNGSFNFDTVNKVITLEHTYNVERDASLVLFKESF